MQKSHGLSIFIGANQTRLQFNISMGDDSELQEIVDKLKNGIHFGLFNEGQSCVFQDGTGVSYGDLWLALRAAFSIPPGVCRKTINEICPDVFEGTFSYSSSRHRWKKK